MSATLIRPLLKGKTLCLASYRKFTPRNNGTWGAAGKRNASTDVADPTNYCRDLVRKHNYESFLISQFIPRNTQDGFFALKAFSTELAMVQEAVSSPMLGKMRMQFWRDALKGIAEGRPPRHPIALALYNASQQAHLPSYHMKRIVDARDSELQNPTHLTVDSLVAHAESTSSTLLYLLLSLQSLNSSDLSHAASHLGIAQTFAILLRALPFHASKGRMVIPAEITAKHGVSQEEVFRKGGNAKGIEDAVFEFATIANDHIITARDVFKSSGGKVPTNAMPIFLTAAPITSFLERLEALNFDAFHPSLQLRDWKLPWKVWKSYYKRSF